MTTLDELYEPDRSGYKVVWLGKGYPSWLLRSERVHLIHCRVGAKEERKKEERGETTYDVFETFSRPLAWPVKLLVGGTLVDRFGQWNEELKGFVERRRIKKLG